MLRKWDINNKDLTQKNIDQVIARISDINDPQSVGIIAAQEITDIILENMGPEIYNKAVDDILKLLKDKTQEIEYNIEDLKQA